MELYSLGNEVTNALEEFEANRILLRRRLPFLSVFARVIDEENLRQGEGVKTMAVNSKNLWYGDEFVKRLSKQQFRAILLHELYHLLYGHLKREHTKIHDHNLANTAQDLRINSELFLEMQEYAKFGIKYEFPNVGMFPRKKSWDDKKAEKIWDSGEPFPNLDVSSLDMTTLQRYVKMTWEEIYVELYDDLKKQLEEEAKNPKNQQSNQPGSPNQQPGQQSQQGQSQPGTQGQPGQNGAPGQQTQQGQDQQGQSGQGQSQQGMGEGQSQPGQGMPGSGSPGQGQPSSNPGQGGGVDMSKDGRTPSDGSGQGKEKEQGQGKEKEQGQGTGQGTGENKEQGEGQEGSEGGKHPEASKKRSKVVKIAGNNMEVGDDGKLLDDGMDDHSKLDEEAATTAREVLDEKREDDLRMAERLQEMTQNSCGSMPGALKGELFKMKEVKISWRKAYERMLKELTRGEDTYKRPLRSMQNRDTYIPTASRSKPLQYMVFCGIDTSGSIGKKLLESFFGTLYEVSHKYAIDKSCEVGFWDSMMGNFYSLKDSIKQLSKGQVRFEVASGGTNVMCYFNHLKERRSRTLEPQVILVFTDGYFTMPTKESIPKEWHRKILWVVWNGYNKSLDNLGIGKVVHIEIPH